MASKNIYQSYIQQRQAASQPAAQTATSVAHAVSRAPADLAQRVTGTEPVPAATSRGVVNSDAQGWNNGRIDNRATQPTASKTTYIDANGEKREGYIIDGRTYQDAGGTTPVGAGSIVNAGGTQYIKMPDGSGMLYSEYLAKQNAAAQPASYAGAAATPAASYSDGGSAAPAQSSGGSAPYQTVYYDSRGNQKTGYIINGKTYTDAAGTQEVPVGSYVKDSSGRVWYKGNGNVSTLVSSPLEEDHYDYMTGVSNGREIQFTNPDTGKVNYIAANPDKGQYIIYDSKHNSLGYIDNAGVYHSAYYDTAYDKITSEAALAALRGAGYAFDGNGIVKIAAGDDLNLDRAFLVNQYSDALARGEDGADILAKLGAQYDENGKVVSIPGASIAAGSGIQAAGDQAAGGQSVQTGKTETLYTDQLRQQEAEREAERARIQSEQTKQLETIQRKQQEYQAAGSAQIQALEQQLAEVDRLLTQAKADNESAYALQLEQARANIQRQIDALNEQFRNLNKQLYVDYMMARRDLPQRLAAQGYTGGLRESSMLGLETGYGANLAQNERERMTGIRDIEAGGLENERELGIAQIQAQREAEDQAYTRAAAVRAAMIEQQNLQERYRREDEAAARKEAREQIDAYLSAGGSPGAISQDLLALSGYDGAYLYAVADAVQRAEAQKQANALLSAGGSVPSSLGSAAGWSTDYLDAITAAQQAAQEKAAAASAKPVLTAAQVNEAIKNGNLAPNVLSAYEYYYGVPYEQPAAAASGYTGGVYDNTGAAKTGNNGNSSGTMSTVQLAEGIKNYMSAVAGVVDPATAAREYAYNYVDKGIIDADVAAAVVADILKGKK